MEKMQNLYEVRKSLRFELKPSEVTMRKLETEKLFENKIFMSKIFSQNYDAINYQAEKKENNYLFSINEDKLNELVEKCDKKIENIKNIKEFIEDNPNELWRVWIDNEKIKIIDKDLKYILEEKSSWKKVFWNPEKKDKNTGNKGVKSKFTVKWKKGLFLTFDDIDAYFEKTRSTENKDPKAGDFTNMFIDKISFLLKQYEVRKYQLGLNTKGNIEENEKKLFQTKRERISRIRSFLGMFLKLESVISVLNFNYKDNFSEFPVELKEIIISFNEDEDVNDIISEIELIFSESNLYLHKNIERKFSLNIRAINPNPENTKDNKIKTENEIFKDIEVLEEKISKLKNLKAQIKGERKDKKNSGDTNWKEHKKNKWDDVLKKLNPKGEESLFSKLTELRRDLEEVHLTHFAVLLEKEGLFYLALENKRVNNSKNGEIKKINNLELGKFFTKSNSGESKFLNYNVITFQGLRRLCLEESSSMKTENFLNKNNGKWTKWSNQQKKSININWRDEEYFDDLKDYLKFILKNNTDKIGVNFTENDFKEWKDIKWDENLENLEKIINKQGYKANWENFNFENLKKLEEEGNIELFQIYNKDFLIDKDFVTSNSDKEKFERIEYTKEQFKKEGKEFIPKYKDEYKKHKRNLFTIYWQDLFNDEENNQIRIKQEGKFYIRLAGEEEGERKISDNFSIKNKKRYSENKIFADFNLLLNPNTSNISKRCKQNKEFQKKYIKDFNLDIKGLNPKYYIGLDQGVNSLVSYCVMDENENIVTDKNGKPEIGDLSLVISNGENQGQFVEVEDTIIVGGDKGVWSEDKGILEQEEPNKRILKIDGNIKVFDYAEAIYSESYKRRKEIEKYCNNEIDFDEVSNLKKGYSSFVLHKIEQLAKKYSPAIISLEYLQDQKNKSRFVNKNGEGKKIDKQSENPKIYRFGTSTIECIEDALLKKFQFWYGKTENGKKQLVPFFSNKEELYKKGLQLGNIIFIDEKDTSVLCPSCKELLTRCKNPYHEEEWKRGGLYTDEDTKNIYGQFRKVFDILKHNPYNVCNWNSSEKNEKFSFIKSGDDLATYNIAKKGLEYIKNLK